MQAIGFDNDKYLRMQSEKIRERISQFGGKLYLEFGGKLFDDYHASRVLPGFAPDSKVRMLMEMKDDAEIIIAISADDIERNKRRGDLGITYDDDTLRLIDAFQGCGLYVGSVVITHHRGQPAAEKFQRRLEALGIRVYRHYIIPDYPSDIARIVSDDGFGRNDYIETTRSLIVVTAPGPGSGKMATCLSQLYHEHKRGVCAGYAKFETFPIWNLPLRHPVNLAYEAATVDLDDVNMIDPFHLEAYGVTTVNYNRDVEIFPVLNAMFQRIYGSSPYKSPTDMGVNMAGYCISDDAVCCAAARQEILRRYYTTACAQLRGLCAPVETHRQELLHHQLGLPAFPVLHQASWPTRLRYGWDFREASPLEQVKKCRLPMLFIHGTEDTFVPTWMGDSLYVAKTGIKEIWHVEGATHADSYLKYAKEYTEIVKSFVERYNIPKDMNNLPSQ